MKFGLIIIFKKNLNTNFMLYFLKQILKKNYFQLRPVLRPEESYRARFGAGEGN